MLDSQQDRPPSDVIQALRDRGMTGLTDWTRLQGGRTNRLWAFHSGSRTFVCKLYSDKAATPLFPNDADAEANALNALAGSGLAPRLERKLHLPSGPVLIYEHVTQTGLHSPAATASALARLHDQMPHAGLRQLAQRPLAILHQGEAMLRGVTDQRVEPLKALRPLPPETTVFAQVFLHGDPVPANVIQTATGPCFIDWQCPAIGDPSEDLALYLSPAMQHLYGGQPLDSAQISAFLAAYDYPERAARYRHLMPLYHWRMAAYCLWKTRYGDKDYSIGADLEIARLKEIS